MDEAFKEEYAKYYDMFNQGKDYSKEVDFIISAFNKYGKIKSVLDLGCGTGLHDVLLSKKGYSITGLDLSKEQLNIAQSRNTGNIKFVQGDMSNFNLNRKFDACISMFSSFVYLTENKQLSSAIKHVKEHLNPNGLFILDCWNGLGVMHELPSSRTKEAEIKNIKIVRTSYPTLHAEKHLCDVKFSVKILDNGKLVKEYDEVHHTRFFFPMELKKYLEDEGFEVLEICKTYELGAKISEKDWNMVIISKLK
jgi:SAM-dependent methyltransferase